MAQSLEDTTLNRSPSVTPTPHAAGGPSAYLVVISGPSFGEMYKLKGERSTLGRGDRADIRVLDDGVSREHAAVEREGGKMVLVDLGSTNGTFCNGARVKRQDLTDGDKVSIGATTILRFTYQDQVDEHYQKKLFESALRDGLTSTFNRRYFVVANSGQLPNMKTMIPSERGKQNFEIIDQTSNKFWLGAFTP